uniref:PD-(D/E)XK nuclease family transposase n=1 Tax=Candidatus Kentrum sp. FW TaxID=2126338 RepID=A0A450U1G0_9GAMM|nr:MAG: PD-(D/E)XK nuclease family transposase [Candidatus Kentron sp. FW]
MMRKLINFDWALKKLLRSKANYEVLEGFLSELLKDDIEILEILESESNRDYAHDKSNRVDLKVRNQKAKSSSSRSNTNGSSTSYSAYYSQRAKPSSSIWPSRRFTETSSR